MRCLELRLDALALVGLQASVEHCDAIGFEAVADEQVLQPSLGVSVLGEDDDPFVVPETVGPARARQPGQKRGGLGVRAMRLSLGPFEHLRKQCLLFVRERLGSACGGRERVLRPFVEGVIGVDVVVKAVELRSKAVLGHVFGGPFSIERAHVLTERLEERLG